MLRTLVVPAVFIATAILTGCQAIQKNELPLKETTKQQTSQSESSEPTSESKIPLAPDAKPAEQPVAAPEPKNIITVKEEVIQIPAHMDGRLVLGLSETASLPNLELSIRAKLDTGAENTSADARNITLFERDRKKWVKFELARTSKGSIPLELPVKETIKIKRPGSPSVNRLVVSMTIAIGDITQPVDITLTDREQFEFPLLVGRNFMQDLAVIDVHQNDIADMKVIETRTRQIEAPLSSKPYTKRIRQRVSIEGLKVLGSLENMSIPGININLPARIDTGAKTSSLDARNLKIFTKEKKNWVRFEIPDTKGQLISIEKPVTRFISIKRHGLANERRPVVAINAQIGDLVRLTQFSLRSREGYKYPILVGVRFLENTAVVDVSQEFTTSIAQRDK